MQYVAVRICSSGGIVRHEDTQEVSNVLVGDFDSIEDAINQACIDLTCTHLLKGVLSKGQGMGDFMIVDTQELAQI